jgi:hypothetical protein
MTSQAWSWIGAKWQGARRFGGYRVKEGGASIPGLGVEERKSGTAGTNGMDERQTRYEDGSSHYVGFLRVLRSMSCRLSPSWLTHSCSSFCSIYYLYVLIRRPRLILDFALTLVFNHLVLTTYYSASVPTSLFFWLVLILGSALTVITAEQLCVKREMREGLAVPLQSANDVAEEMELGTLLRRD